MWSSARLAAAAHRLAAASAVAVAVSLAAAIPAAAVNVPIDPPAGKHFDTTEAYGFEVGHDPDDLPWAIKLSPDEGVDRWIIFPADDPDVFEVDMGWLATKYNHVGRFTWSVCDYDTDSGLTIAGSCSDPRPFYIRFRLSTLTAATARFDSRRVFKKLSREALPANGVKCRRNSRSKQTCKVGTYIGDTVIYGRVVLWNKRPSGSRAFDLTRYRATLRIYDEYCHVVDKRPLSECDRPYKKRSGWTY